MKPPKPRELWYSLTTGEKILLVLQFAIYGWVIYDVIHWQLLRALALTTLNGVLVLILMWSLNRPRGSGL